MRKLNWQWAACWLIAAWVAGHTPAWADECDTGVYSDLLVDRYALKCLEANPALEERVAAVSRAFYEQNPAVDRWPEAAREQFEALRSTVNAAMASADANQKTALTALASALADASAASAKLPDADVLGAASAATDYPDLLIDHWKVDNSPAAHPGGLAARYLEQEGCLDSTSGDARCDAVFARALVLADHSHLGAQVASILTEPARAEYLREAVRREERWHSYLYDTQFPYAWELAFNRYLDERCPKPYELLGRLVNRQCPRLEQDRYGNVLGFREPPTHRAILLHPDIGLQYIDDEPSGERLKPSLVIQWIGYQWWKWDGNDVSGLWGVSVVSTLSDTSESDSLGIGLQVQRDQYAVAVTSHGGAWAITLNLRLVDRLGKVNKKLATRLKAPLQQ